MLFLYAFIQLIYANSRAEHTQRYLQFCFYLVFPVFVERVEQFIEAHVKTLGFYFSRFSKKIVKSKAKNWGFQLPVTPLASCTTQKEGVNPMKSIELTLVDPTSHLSFKDRQFCCIMFFFILFKSTTLQCISKSRIFKIFCLNFRVPLYNIVCPSRWSYSYLDIVMSNLIEEEKQKLLNNLNVCSGWKFQVLGWNSRKRTTFTYHEVLSHEK